MDGLSLSDRFQQCFQLIKAFNFIIGPDISAGFAVRVDPDGLDPGIDTSLNIRAETIAYNDGLFRIKTGDGSKAGIKIGF